MQGTLRSGFLRLTQFCFLGKSIPSKARWSSCSPETTVHLKPNIYRESKQLPPRRSEHRGLLGGEDGHRAEAELAEAEKTRAGVVLVHGK